MYVRKKEHTIWFGNLVSSKKGSPDKKIDYIY